MGPLHFLRSKWRQDFLLRLYAGVFLAVALTTALYTVYALKSLRDEADSLLKERVERLASVLSESLARPLFDINTAAVKSVVDALGGTPEVIKLKVYDSEGMLVAGTSMPDESGAETMSATLPVQFKEETRVVSVGRIELALSRKNIDQDLHSQISQTIVVNLLLLLTIIGSIYLVARTLSRPFADIQDALDKLAHGQTDIRLSGAGREDQIGQLSEAVRSFRDTITRLRQAEKASADLLADKIDMVDRLHAIFEGSNDAIILLTQQGVFDCNRQAVNMFGMDSKEELLGSHPARFSPPFQPDGRDSRSAANARIQVALESGQNRFEWMHTRKDGSAFPAEVLLSAFMYDGKKVLQATVRDITERKQIEKKILELNEELEEKIAARTRELTNMMQVAEAASLAKSDFLANMSHEIRTPMNAIIGMAYLALQTELNPKQRDYVGKIHRAAMSLLGIINDILDFSKIEAGKLDVEAVPFSLDEVLTSVASVTSQKAADKQLEYLMHVPKATPRHLVGDPLRLGQVLINLVNNAIKFTDSGEIEVSCTPVEEAHSDDRVRLRFAVRDTGIGMTAEQRTKLFQPFTQADGSTSRKYGGTGLGLSISQRLVELMGGSIGVDTEAGRGTTFYFTLELPPAELPHSNEVLPAALNSARILVVDDSAFARRILVENLQALPLRVDVAGSAEEAMQTIRTADAANDPYRLILTDWQMPQQDGIALIRSIRGDKSLLSQPRLVLVTAFDREAVHREADEAGADAFLVKPISHSALVDMLVAMFAPGDKPVAPRQAPQHQFDGSRILLAEDNDINQQIAVELLHAAGIQVEIAHNGREAVDRLRSVGAGHYRLVLMDLEMPEMDGHAATLAIRSDARFAALPIIAMTAHALAEVRERCMREGMQDYLTKPINPEHLYSVLGRWLGTLTVEPATQNDVPAPLAGLSCIDTRMGLLRSAGNTGMYLQLLERFCSSQREAAVALREDLAAGRRDDAVRRAHTLRSVAGNVGASAVQTAAEAVEAALAELGNDAVDPAVVTPLETLQTTLSEAVAELDAYFTRHPRDTGDSAAPAASLSEALAALAQLQALLDEFNGDAPDYFERVRASLRQLLDDASLKRVASHIHQYEYDSARELLSPFVAAQDRQS